jgi:hypothetical protein
MKELFSEKLPADAAERFAVLAGLGYSPLFTLLQKHGDTIVRLRKPFDCPDFELLLANQPEGDAIVTNQPGLFIGVKTADCVPILLFDGTKEVAAAVHAGWRGTALGIAEKTVAVMREEFGARDIVASIGPCICKKCFVTRSDVPEAMPPLAGEFIEQVELDRYRVDLPGINAQMMYRAGVSLVESLDVCTCCNPDVYWSHRAHGTERGLQVSLIGV